MLANEIKKLEYKYIRSTDTSDYNAAYSHDDNHHDHSSHHLPEDLGHVIHFRYRGRKKGGIMIWQVRCVWAVNMHEKSQRWRMTGARRRKLGVLRFIRKLYRADLEGTLSGRDRASSTGWARTLDCRYLSQLLESPGFSHTMRNGILVLQHVQSTVCMEYYAGLLQSTSGWQLYLPSSSLGRPVNLYTFVQSVHTLPLD